MSTGGGGIEERPDADVVIAGGGLAGLTCAVGLLGSGLRVLVIEREPILGGRARSWADPATGDPVAVGPHIFISEYPNAPMAIPCPLVGSERLRLPVRTPIDGLWLAGDWLRTGLPYSMESACLSGWRAAEAILEAVDRPRPLAQPHRELGPLAAVLGWAAGTLRRSGRRTRRDPVLPPDEPADDTCTPNEAGR